MHAAAAVADGFVCWPKSPLEKAQDAARYAGVLAVWLALALIRPRLALDIFVNRRPDSPIPRRRQSTTAFQR
ncbi:hypothetical protein ACFODL_09470 [Phenylobacterium terrae]|uniref:Uncharacterized protein n=1 Tax=Phenylobacterium terrae TaxID=2665495 RepID=A0ABW4N5W0_9CAUL